MRIAVAGGTGTVGRHTVEAVRAAGHDAVVLSRSQGVDLVTGKGLDYALAGADAVIDVASIETLKASAAIEFFTAATGNLVSAAANAGVGHVVLLSIVGIDRIPYDYYAGKIAQEKIFEASRVPWTILRATQFHEFAGQMFERAKLGPLHVAPNARTQPVAASEVGERLAELAAADPQGRVRDLAGPREEQLSDMVRAFARRTGFRGWIPRINVPGPQMAGMRAGHALPGPDADLGRQSFTEWLAAR
ncbi:MULTISPECIES: SDR family oxidoreductase [unclassified Microbacterium]|uniref:SDR family oxidoreductase n=1 Tax=unclassified Microbacterium TaxID=2609290 RepID=UPI000CFDA101|nr:MULTISPECIES: NAD(P)H-binding protein [unclassified Microbacterium]PQZ53723.1 3-beta hydroxysteroid dehydrogenase [Microbacterium sp. MYb43]PQZ76248.1 3-beta hydroxysteroid dehydrogenase [Microbacterium sp. MYb40]PRB21360.1 3-beta hydroxysteroid dehydrogenase [Microbacterium sp. MYb54]PRB29923.1 3-beta hydroxysteroid dehydrogenase [Microbacterium sp. MYb50]PRB67916.1 3-beta hydroxysteroid dehydrogenase [Microbacterium sp. MYb24]